MRVIHIEAEQGHAVPKTVMGARGPFGKYEPARSADENPSDPYPSGATAQNGMRGVVLYDCNNCGATVREDNLDSHECEE